MNSLKCDNSNCLNQSDNPKLIAIIKNDSLSTIPRILDVNFEEVCAPHKFRICSFCLRNCKELKMDNICHRCRCIMIDPGMKLLSGIHLCRFCLNDDIIEKTYKSMNMNYPGWSYLVKSSSVKYPTASVAITN